MNSANQLSIYGAVADWYDELAEPSRNRLRDHQEKFENLSKEIKVSQTCEIAGFMRKVSWAMLPNNSLCKLWIWKKNWSMHREYTLLRDDANSEQLSGFVDTRRTDQPLKSVPHVIVSNMELKFRYHPCCRTDLYLGF